MSDFVNVKVVGNHVVHHTPDPKKPEEVKTSADAPFKMSADQFAELGPDGLRAVRKASKEDRAAGASTDAPQTTTAEGTGGVRTTAYTVEELAEFAAKHRGGGRWDVVNGEVLIQSDFDSKAAAEDWIVDQRKTA